MRGLFRSPVWRALPLAALLVNPAATPADQGAAFEIHEIAPGIFVHQGVPVALEDPRHDDIANIGFIVGQKCVAAIDTGGSLRIGTLLREAIRAHTNLPVCYVINTHAHYDHVLGNAAFRVDDPKFIGHVDLADAIDATRDYFLQQFAADLGSKPGPDSIIGPDLTVDGHLEIDLGGRMLSLAAHPAAHSYSDLTVWDGTTGTLWLSDLLFIDRMPAVDGSLLGWIQLIEEMQAVAWVRVVPGHGPASADWPGSADKELRYLRDLRDDVRAGIANGVFLEDMQDAPVKDSVRKWLLYENNQRRNISKAYTELEWE